MTKYSRKTDDFTIAAAKSLGYEDRKLGIVNNPFTQRNYKAAYWWGQEHYLLEQAEAKRKSNVSRT